MQQTLTYEENEPFGIVGYRDLNDEGEVRVIFWA